MDLRGELIGGRYRLQDQIGEGGMAVVYRATDVSLGREVAVKILRPEVAEDREFLAAFRREAHAAARLQHPHIVQIFDTGMDGGWYYIVMEYMPEPDFKHILRRFAPLPLRKALEVGIQTCEALAYAHARDIVHRDIKPHNILFTREGIAKVSDFGIACPAGAPGREREGRVVGSAAYISPEQARGDPATPQSDLYSLGVVLYEAVTGRTPFRGQTPEQIAEKHVRERPVPPRALNPEISPSAEYVVMKALAKDTARRYQSAADMLRDLRKLAAGTTLEQTGVLPAPEGATSILGQRPGAEPTVPLRAAAPPAARPPAPGAARPATAPVRRATVREAEGPPLWMGVLAAFAALIVLAGAAAALWYAMYPHDVPVKVKVPSLVGKTVSEAEVVLTRQGLQIGRITEQESATGAAGFIVSQSPEAGEFVEEHTDVSIVLAKGAATVVVPDVEGEDVPTADRMLKQANLVRGKQTPEPSNTVAAGIVIRQSVGPGTTVDEGTAIDLTVSSGPPPEVTIPANQPALAPDEGPGPDLGGEHQISIELDPTFQGESDQARINVHVIVGGTKPGQWVEVISRDLRGTHIQESAHRDSGDTFEKQVTAQGDTTIEVKIDNEVVGRREFQLPPAGGTD